MKLKKLKKKIQQLEKRLREGPEKLAKLKRKLQQAASAKALKAARKSAVGATASAEKKSGEPTTGGKKAKRKLNLSPERRAQLAATMKARWAAKRAAEEIAQLRRIKIRQRRQPSHRKTESTVSDRSCRGLCRKLWPRACGPFKS